MEIGYIDSAQMQFFSNLLLPQTVEAIQNGEPITALGIVKDSIACGAIAGYITEGKFRIVSFYVAPEFRRQGGGRMLLEGIRKLLEDEVMVSGVEIRYTVTQSEHETMASFLLAMQFEKEDDKGQTLYTFTLGQAANDILAANTDKQDVNVLPFVKISDHALHMAQKEASIQDIPLPQVTLDSPELDRELSHSIVKNGSVQAFVVFDHSCCGLPTLCSAWSGNVGQTALIRLLRPAFQRATQLYGMEARMAVQAVTPATAALIQNIVPGAMPISFSYYLPIDRI